MSRRTDTITILGAGAMGSALAAPAADNGHEVRLWGTWLDDELLDAVEQGRPHPRTGVPLDSRVKTYRSGELAEALSGATYVVLSISSDGVMNVLRKAAGHLRPGQILAITTKGFVRRDGQIVLLPEAVADVLREAAPDGSLDLPLVAVGGPCKANEVAARRPTASVHACTSLEVAARSGALFATSAYAVEASDDPVGVEVAAALKNVYAISLGVCQGMAQHGGEPYHDLQAAAFAQAVTEMVRLAGVLGGRAETVTGLAGVGDLEVTALSGRNRVYGTRVGSGEGPHEAMQAMRAAGQTVEGVPAALLARQLVDELVRSGALPDWSGLPLLRQIAWLLDGQTSCSAEELTAAFARAALPTHNMTAR
ncbi:MULTISPECIES: NAD(P)H-dependent glycerol-3-phosphate dehydrogenase [unclassified Streptomyces]|uniref:NAD(P)H-dependent glycerol-3-phosphate dehydrogenase n=1 Tax=unclassified Streptomyces TaxID=2593676 RepID=UPI000F6DCC11|nr:MULTISPECIES: NAD(P)-binding domain-containing protein [unclassified Streptomyces]AZM58486.1 glycerol-3-phosphate dehydrogenase [Streptomyces sp. WAC 01438]RSM88996.1 glycerol-3-phosphate dehydrogenase [Streptomyces sp. WAC 01420]